MDYLDQIPTAYIFAAAGIALGFLAVLARIDRMCARADRRQSEIDRNAAADLYRRAAAHETASAAFLREHPDHLKDVIGRLMVLEAIERDRAKRSPLELVGVFSRSAG